MKTSLFQLSWAYMKVASHKYQCRESNHGGGSGEGGGGGVNVKAVIQLNTACGGSIFKESVLKM